MNKEEIGDLMDIADLITENEQLQQENKQLQERIDKAIELLELAKESGLISIRTILEILKGSDK